MRTLCLTLFAVATSLCYIPQDATPPDAFPATILDARALFVRFVRIRPARVESAPEGTRTGRIFCEFELTVYIDKTDPSFWDFVPFDLIGRLPNGSEPQITMSREALLWPEEKFPKRFVTHINCDISGTAVFILAPRDASYHANLLDYPLRSAQRSVYLDCSPLNSSDVE